MDDQEVTQPITRVSTDRWQQAQSWERELWEGSQVKRGWKRLVWPVARPLLRAFGARNAHPDDWNYWWADHFGSYSFLPRHVGEYIELGCGPYTNSRIILRGRTWDRVVCSDPLINTYITFGGTWLATGFRAGWIEIDSHAVEELTFPDESFDVAVVINVLDHVYDAALCLEQTRRVLKRGGILVLGQDLSDGTDLANVPFDLGHPIRLHRDDVEPILATFETLYCRQLSRTEGRAPEAHYGTLLFAGAKR